MYAVYIPSCFHRFLKLNFFLGTIEKLMFVYHENLYLQEHFPEVLLVMKVPTGNFYC